MDVGAFYQRGKGEEVRVDVLLNSAAHDSAACYLIRGEKPLWRQQVTLGTGDASASFDTAAFEQDARTVLVASTECSGEVCAALPLGARLVPSDLTFSDLLWRLHAAVPVQIVTEEANSSGQPEQLQRLLLERLNTFLGGFDLAPLRQYIAPRPG